MILAGEDNPEQGRLARQLIEGRESFEGYVIASTFGEILGGVDRGGSKLRAGGLVGLRPSLTRKPKQAVAVPISSRGCATMNRECRY
jgi:hypothetical protein